MRRTSTTSAFESTRAEAGPKRELPGVEGARRRDLARRVTLEAGRSPARLPCGGMWPHLDDLVDGARALLHRDAGPDVRSCRLQRPPRGGGRRPAPEGARGAVPARAGVARRRSDDLAAARGDAELAEMVADYEAEVARLEEELKLALVETRPGRREGRDRRGPAGRRRRRGGALGGRRCADAPALRRAPRLQVGAARGRARTTAAGIKEGGLRGQGRRRVLGLQVRGRHASRAARARRPSRRAASTPRPRPSP